MLESGEGRSLETGYVIRLQMVSCQYFNSMFGVYVVWRYHRQIRLLSEVAWGYIVCLSFGSTIG